MQTIEAVARVALQQILFLTDFSPGAASAFPYAISLARQYKSKVLLAHILPPRPRHAIPLEPLPEEMDQYYVQAKQEVEKFLGTKPFADIPHEVLLERGELWPALSDIITEHKVDLIVLSTHGRHGLGKLLLGSVAEEVFRLASCPILTVGPKAASPRAEIARILFATDFSSGSLHALPYALSLAETNHAHLTLLHVLPEPDLAHAAGETYELRARDEEKTKRELQMLVPAEEAFFRENCEFLVDYGTPAESILVAAKEKEAGLIVMGARRTRSVVAATHLPWTTTHKVVAEASCPVLTVRG